MTTLSPLQFFLCPQPATTVFTGRVDGTPSDPYINIGFDAGVTGSFGNPLPSSMTLTGIIGRKARGLC